MGLDVEGSVVHRSGEGGSFSNERPIYQTLIEKVNISILFDIRRDRVYVVIVWGQVGLVVIRASTEA